MLLLIINNISSFLVFLICVCIFLLFACACQRLPDINKHCLFTIIKPAGSKHWRELIQHWCQPGKITHYTHSFPMPDFTDTGHWSLYDGSLTPAHTVILSTLPQQQQQQLLLHPFNGLFSRTTWVSCYQKGKTSLDLDEARDDGGRWLPLASRPLSVCSACCGMRKLPPVSCFGRGVAECSCLPSQQLFYENIWWTN